MNTFLSTSGYRQMHTFSGLWKEQEMHGCSEMKMAKASPLVTNNSGSFWRFTNQNLWFGCEATRKVGSSSAPGENKCPHC